MRFQDIRKITQVTYSVGVRWNHLEHWLSDTANGIDMDPEFQRGHVWTTQQQTAYCEHVLRGGISGGDLYFNCPNWPRQGSVLTVVDGKQRITAVSRFLGGEIPVFGHNISDYTDKLPHQARFTVHVNDLESHVAVIKWYLDLNSGGTPHSGAELARVRALLEGAAL